MQGIVIYIYMFSAGVKHENTTCLSCLTLVIRGRGCPVEI